jgi:hypothetical protein
VTSPGKPVAKLGLGRPRKVGRNVRSALQRVVQDGQALPEEAGGVPEVQPVEIVTE